MREVHIKDKVQEIAGEWKIPGHLEAKKRQDSALTKIGLEIDFELFKAFEELRRHMENVTEIAIKKHLK